MKSKIVLGIALSIVLTACGQKREPEMESIFNGDDLQHWNVPNTGEWSVQDGVLLAKSNSEKKGSILWTKEKFDDFVVQLDFKFVDGTIDSGIFMRGDDEKNPQIQIGISGSLKRDMTGSPYVPGASYPVEAEGIKKLLKPKAWNTMKARAKGNTYTVWLNGEEVMNYTMEDANLNGPIGLQLHPGKEMAIEFKNIQVGQL